MQAIKMFFLAVSLIAGLVLYVTAFAIGQPPLWASLFAREDVTVTASTVETRSAEPSALPVIEVRDARGGTALLHGHSWMSRTKAQRIVESASVGATLSAPHWQGKMWRGLSGIGDYLLLAISLFASVAMLFGLRMIWKLRGQP